MTPSSLSKGGSMHQKQPPANVALARGPAVAGCGSLWVQPTELKVTNALESTNRKDVLTSFGISVIVLLSIFHLKSVGMVSKWLGGRIAPGSQKAIAIMECVIRRNP